MSTQIDWNDVARFASEYMSGVGRTPGSDDLLTEIARAYLRSRGLPSSEMATVIQMVDSVL
jgi:hypothetical protein